MRGRKRTRLLASTALYPMLNTMQFTTVQCPQTLDKWLRDGIGVVVRMKLAQGRAKRAAAPPAAA